MKQTELMVRYTREFTVAMFAYVIVLVASNSLLMRMETDPAWPWRIPVAVAPVVPVIFILNAILRLLLESDELQQRIQLSAIAFGAAATGLLTFTYGFLEGIGFPHLSFVWVLPVMVMMWGLGLAVYSRRYR